MMTYNQLDFSNVSVLVLGDVMLDAYIEGSVHRISPEAPVPIVSVTERTYTLGGAGNVALNLAELGCAVSLIGVRGVDEAGGLIKSFLRSRQIQDRMVIDSECITTMKTRIIGNRQQQLLRFDEEQPRRACSPSWNERLSIKDLVSSFNVVVLSDYAKGFLSQSFVQDVIVWAQTCNKPVLADPPYKGDWEPYRNSTILTPNLLELYAEARIESDVDHDLLYYAMESAASHYGVDWMVTTLGEDGVALYCCIDKTKEIMKSIAKEVYDVSGAGDTMIATLAACVGAKIPVKDAVRISNVAAGIVVGKRGTQPILIDELREALCEN